MNSTPPFLNRILVATGQMEPCEKAAEFARTLARQHGSRMVVLHTCNPLLVEARGHNVTKEIEELARWTRKMRLTPYIDQRFVLHQELPVAAKKLFKDSKAGVLLVGTHGAKGLERLLVGSAAEELMRSGSVPVFIIGPGVPNGRQVQFRNILFATDLSAVSFKAVALLRELQQAFGSRITVLHVMPNPPRSVFERHQLRQKTHTLISDNTGDKIEVAEIAIEEGEPVKTIAEFVSRSKADVLALGIRTGSEFTRASTHLRSLTSRIIAAATCPVLTIASTQRR